jgi:hypothetical protein
MLTSHFKKKKRKRSQREKSSIGLEHGPRLPWCSKRREKRGKRDKRERKEDPGAHGETKKKREIAISSPPSRKKAVNLVRRSTRVALIHLSPPLLIVA